MLDESRIIRYNHICKDDKRCLTLASLLKKVPTELILAMLNTDFSKVTVTKKNSKRPKRGYTVSKVSLKRG